jgi:hypothetical protein
MIVVPVVNNVVSVADNLVPSDRIVAFNLVSKLR